MPYTNCKNPICNDSISYMCSDKPPEYCAKCQKNIDSKELTKGTKAVEIDSITEKVPHEDVAGFKDNRFMMVKKNTKKRKLEKRKKSGNGSGSDLRSDNGEHNIN